MLTFNEKLEEIKRLKKTYRQEDEFDSTEVGCCARCVDHTDMYDWCRNRAE